MATTCVDNTDQTVRNRLLLSNTGPTVNSEGAYTLNQIDVFAQELADNMLKEAENNPIQIAENKFGNAFYDSVNYLNGSFRNRMQGALGDFPDLEKRWNSGNITNLEGADFLNVKNYTPDGIVNERDYVKLARTLDAYYKDSFAQSIMGGFCQSMQNIFQQIESFYDLLDEVNAIIADAMAFIDKIRSYDGLTELTAQQIIDKIIKEIKDKILEVVDKIIQEVEDALSNFDIEAIVGEIKAGQAKGVKAIMTIKELQCQNFTKENKDQLKRKLSNLIDYAVSLFENPNLEQIQFMVFRFCALAANIELLLRDIKKPMDDYGFRYSRIVNRLKAISNVNSSTAIRNGGIRFSEEKRQESINSLRALWEDEGRRRITPTGEQPVTIKPITAAEYKNIPKCGQVYEGTHEWLKVARGEDDPFHNDNVGINAYLKIDLDVKVYLTRIRDDIGGTYEIIDGWVSKEWNEAQENDPDNSHLSGLVIDIKKDMDDVNAFTEAAYKHGFKTVVEYDEHIHLDLRELPVVWQ